MHALLCGLLEDLERRCLTVREKLTAASDNADVRDQALSGYREIESTRREVAALLADPDLAVPALLPNYLRTFQELSQRATLVESYFLPFVERFSGTDRRLTHLVGRLTQQVRWPLPPPLVAAFSTQYYWTLPQFNLVCAPAAEGFTLLGLPDLCHELGHILLMDRADTLIGDFERELLAYITEEQQRAVAEQRPSHLHQLYNLLYELWKDSWLYEFGSDMIATYMVGPAFGWQHVRLCASDGQPAYHPTLGERAEHPANDARLSGMVVMLVLLGQAETANRLRALWDGLVEASGEQRPEEYEACYPASLIEALARRVVDGCSALGLRRFDEADDPAVDISALIGEAWDRFLADSQTYPQWEQPLLETLWNELDTAP